MYKNHCSDPDILLLNLPQNAGNTFQSIRNKKFSERSMPPDAPGGGNPLFKKILDLSLVHIIYHIYSNVLYKLYE